MTVYATVEDLDRIAAEGSIAAAVEAEEQTFSMTPFPIAGHDEVAKREREVLSKYKALIRDLTKEEELDVLGISLKQVFPPIERDVEKLIIDLNMVVYRYMQGKMETDQEVRAETIRSTVSSALRKVSAALFTIIATEDR